MLSNSLRKFSAEMAVNSLELSIIVPVYNVEEYLRECVDSILLQTFKNFELILVDDGSTDNSPAICDEYQTKDSRVKVIHKVNGGVSSARNSALSQAQGKWITFIDSDDFIAPEFIESLFKPLSECAEDDIDLVHGGCSNYAEGKFIGFNQKYDDIIDDSAELLFNKVRGLIVSKLFRLSLINGTAEFPLRFDEKMRVAEDMAFTLDYILRVRRYAFVSECGYFYRKDNVDSATKKKILPDYNVEKTQYLHFYNSVMTFIKVRSLSSEQSEFRLKQCAQVFYTVICSLYYGTKRHDRLKILSTEWGSNHYILLNHLGHSSFLNSLLQRGLFSTYDALQSSHYRIRQLVSSLKRLIIKR